MMRRLSRVLAPTGLTLLLLLGCGADPNKLPGTKPPPTDPAPNPDSTLYLTIEGSDNVSLREGETTRVTVRYHDPQDAAVQGDISFALTGSAPGAQLRQMVVHTDANGRATAELVAGTVANFGIKASAGYAADAAWRIDVALRELRFAGTYALQSNVDIADGLGGDLGGAIRTLSEMTDGPDDPGTWLIDQMLAQINDPTLTALASLLRPTLDQMVNGWISSQAPGAVNALKTLGQTISSVTHHFGLKSELVVEAGMGASPTQDLVMRHTLKSIVLTFQSTPHELAFVTDLSMPEPVATGITGDVPSDQTINIGEHSFDLSYGRIILAAVNRVIIPTLSPGSSSIEDYLNHQIDCATLGQSIADQIGQPSAAPIITAACQQVLHSVAQAIEDQILSIDNSATHLVWHGDSTLIDSDADRVVEGLSDGQWVGTAEVAGQVSTLSGRPENTFQGNRVGP